MTLPLSGLLRGETVNRLEAARLRTERQVDFDFDSCLALDAGQRCSGALST